MSSFLFAYGTLRPGLAPESIAPVVEKLQPIGTGFVSGVLYDLGEFPGAVLDAVSDCEIPGTVFRLPEGDEALTALDAYEGFEADCPDASLFVRELHEVRMADGGLISCWVYVYRCQVDGFPVISAWPA